MISVRSGAALLILPLCACDLLFQLPHVDATDGGAGTDAPSPCGGTNKLHSTFDDDLALARGWDKENDTNTNVAIVDHAVAITVGVPTGYADALSNMAYDVRGGTMQVKFVEPFFAVDSEMFFAVMMPTALRERCYMGLSSDGTPEGANLGFLCKTDAIAAIGTPKYVTFDPVAHRYLRMVQAGTGITFYTSADGTTWTMRHQVDTPTFAYDSIRFVLGAGSYAPGVMQAQTVRYDDFDFCTP